MKNKTRISVPVVYINSGFYSQDRIMSVSNDSNLKKKTVLLFWNMLLKIKSLFGKAE